MHEIGHDVVQQALIVGDDQHGAIGRAQRVDALGDDRSASMSRPESVSSRMHRFGSRSAICRISLRFFSPPEKPTLSRGEHFLRDVERAGDFPHLLEKSGVDSSLAALLALRIERRVQEGHRGDARNFDRILERQEDAAGGAFVRRHFQEVLAC